MLSILLLSIATLINGGITSKYVRQAQPANEMSLETFPSPAGHNAPEQVLVSSFFINSILIHQNHVLVLIFFVCYGFRFI